MQSEVSEASKCRDLIEKHIIELTNQSDEIIFQPACSSLVEMAKTKRIKNSVILTKINLKKLLVFLQEKNKTTTKPYVFANSERRVEFTTRRQAMDEMNLSSAAIANAKKVEKLLSMMLNSNLIENNFLLFSETVSENINNLLRESPS